MPRVAMSLVMRVPLARLPRRLALLRTVAPAQSGTADHLHRTARSGRTCAVPSGASWVAGIARLTPPETWRVARTITTVTERWKRARTKSSLRRAKRAVSRSLPGAYRR